MSNKFIPAARFHIFTPIFDSFCSLIGLGKNYRIKLISLLSIPSKKVRVLDAGCGTGSLAVQLKKKYSNIDLYGIDIDEAIVQRAIQKAKTQRVAISFKNVSIQDTGFENNYFDIIYSSLVFHHLNSKDKQKAIRELHRILKKDGKLILSDFSKPKNGVYKILLWFSVVLEEGLDNYRGKIPIFLKKCFKSVNLLGTYKLNIDIVEASK